MFFNLQVTWQRIAAHPFARICNSIASYGNVKRILKNSGSMEVENA